MLVGSDIVYSDPTSSSAFLYDITSGTRIDINLPGASRTAFRSIEDSGVISGWFRDSTGTHGFTGYPGDIQVIDIAGWDQTLVEGSNSSGYLVGVYASYDGPGGAFLAIPMPIPEPQTWALMLAGMALLPWARRRR